MGIKAFSTTLGLSLNPLTYARLKSRKPDQAWSYIISLLFIILIISGILISLDLAMEGSGSAVAAIPTVLILFFLAYLIRFVVLALVGTVAVILLSRLTGHRINWRQSQNIALYALTLPMVIEGLNIPFSIPLFGVPLILYFAYIIGAVSGLRRRAEKELLKSK